MSNPFQVGQFVAAAYKTGEYIGEIVELSTKAAVKVVAVLKHPTQGDLHNPQQAEVAFFHQRRALANQEIALMPMHTLVAYAGSVPDYKQSLQAALQAEIEEQENTMRFAQKSLEELLQLKQDYFPEVKSSSS